MYLHSSTTEMQEARHKTLNTKQKTKDTDTQLKDFYAEHQQIQCIRIFVKNS